ncbi:MAG: HlyC/CorC family transporter [Burkholderiaceae bacterium]
MEALPTWAQISILVLLLIASGFFSISEISMMALNRYRLKHLVERKNRSAARTSKLLDDTEDLLGTILIGNNVVNAALTALVTALAIRTFGNNDTVVLVATTIVAVAIILFCEIGPKVVGATYPEKIALPASWILAILKTLLHPFVWAANRVVLGALRTFGVNVGRDHQEALSREEFRSIVAESGTLVPSKHRSILLNLFELEEITVDDVMIPRRRIEAIDLASDERTLREQLTTCYHNKLPVYEGDINRIVGILHVRRALSLLQREDFDASHVRELLGKPYFIPSGTPVFKQLQFFQERKARFALVVDEYGDLQGLVTLADIIEEFVGEITSTGPSRESGLQWSENDDVRVDGATPLRELNRQLGLTLPLDGPKTLNGLVLEALQALPEASVSVRFGAVAVEVIHIENRSIRHAVLHRLSLPTDEDDDEPESTRA